ncbi:neuropeptide receptor A18 [Elysia marginata]|uniref:Neuropeptide receptor A18 n=1 Tax=Elysia marginata TaxID=1093978 RepID=A0AAV4FQ02_9GAST|nr:neuropeptide receptor A18 [Elysia marginata]
MDSATFSADMMNDSSAFNSTNNQTTFPISQGIFDVIFMKCFVYITTGFVGIVGNMLIVCVMTQRQMAGPMSSLFTALAVSDLLFVSNYVTFNLVVLAPADMLNKEYIMLVFLFLIYLSNKTTCWLTVAMAITRCLHIRYAPRRHVLSSVKKARAVCAAIFIYAFVFSGFIYMIQFKASFDVDNRDNLLSSKVYVIVNFVLNCCIPVCLLVLSNVFLIHELADHKHVMARHFKMSRISRRLRNAPAADPLPPLPPNETNLSASPDPQRGSEPHLLSARGRKVNRNLQNSVDVRRVALIVVATTISLLVSYPWLPIIKVYCVYVSKDLNKNIVFSYFAIVFIFLQIANSSMNVFIYSASSCKFRRNVDNMIRRWLTSVEALVGKS